MNQTTIRFLAVLLIGLTVLSTSAMAWEYFRYYRPYGSGYGYYNRYTPPAIGLGGIGTIGASVQAPAPSVKDVTVRVKDRRSGEPIANATVEIYAQVGLGPGEIRGSGTTDSEGKTVISGIKHKWHVIMVKVPGKPFQGYHYLAPLNTSDTFRLFN
jgi:hypothetical protein